MSKSMRVAASMLALSTMLTFVGCERANDKGTPSTTGQGPSGANNPKTGAGGTANHPGPATSPRSTTPPP